MRTLQFAFAALMLVAGCDAMRNGPKPLAKTARFDVYAVAPTKTPGTKQATDPATDAPIFLKTPAIITAADVAAIARPEGSQHGPSLAVNLTPAGARKMAAATAKLKGKPIAILINGTVVSTPKVNSPISTSFIISGGGITQKNEKQLFEALTKN